MAGRGRGAALTRPAWMKDLSPAGGGGPAVSAAAGRGGAAMPGESRRPADRAPAMGLPSAGGGGGASASMAAGGGGGAAQGGVGGCVGTGGKNGTILMMGVVRRGVVRRWGYVRC